MSKGHEGPNMKTLPDYLAPGLDIIFVGINPGSYSAQVGHYFAGPRNRFWPAINRSGPPSFDQWGRPIVMVVPE